MSALRAEIIQIITNLFICTYLKDFSPKATPKPISRRRRLLILFRCVEARTGLARIQVVMTHDDGLRIIQPEREEQIQQRLLLRLGARVGRSALAVESAFVADADRVAVVVLAVGARLLLRSSGMYMSVARDIVMVPDVTEVPVLHVVALAGLEAQALTLRRGRAVNDNQSDGSHMLFIFHTAKIQHRRGPFSRSVVRGFESER